MNELENVHTNPIAKSKKKVLTELQQAFLHYLAHEAKGDLRKAMDLAGYSSNTRPSDITRFLQDEIIQVANDLLAQNSVRAVIGLVEAVNQPGQMGANVKVAAAKEILDRVGVIKKDQNQNTTIKAENIFILPAKDTPKPVELDSSRYRSLPVINVEPSEEFDQLESDSTSENIVDNDSSLD
jgi:hypothetical protein